MEKIISMIKQYLPHLLVALLALWIWSKYFAPCDCKTTDAGATTTESEPGSTETVVSGGMPSVK